MNVGLIGTGLMGYPMAERLLAADTTLTVFNRTAAKAAPLAARGATVAESPTQLLQHSSVVVVMLTDATAIAQVLLSEDSRAQLAGVTIVQMGTIAPQESCDIAEAVASAGGEYLEAPVLGSIPQVEQGILQIMVGAPKNLLIKYQSLLQTFGPEPLHVGPVGTAMALKLAMNQLIAALTASFSLSLGFAQRSGVDVNTFMEIVRGSALYAPTFDKKLQRMLDRNFDKPNFPSKHLAKDIDLFLGAAAPLGLRTEALAGVRAVVADAIAAGLEDKDYSALYNTVNPED